MQIDQQPRLLYDFDLRFPPLSRTVAEVSELLADNGMPDTDRLINIVHMDPLVVASVLRRINSAYYGLRKQFQDIRKAILMIGFIEVCNIVMASGFVGLRKTVKNDVQGRIIDRIMRVSICTGFFADLISQHLRLPDKATAFTAGLLQNIGRFVLLYNLPEEYEKIFDDPEVFIPKHEDETRVLGIDHATIGAMAASHWNFPPLITKLIESYSKPGHLTESEHKNIALVLLASASLAKQLCYFEEDLIATKKNEGSEAELLESVEFPIDLKMPVELNQVAKRKQVSTADLHQLVNDNQQEALEYIDMMMNV